MQLVTCNGQAEYLAEGIAWEQVDFFNNKVVCELIEGTRPAGVLAYLDEECILPKGTDASLFEKLDRSFKMRAFADRYIAWVGTAPISMHRLGNGHGCGNRSKGHAAQSPPFAVLRQLSRHEHFTRENDTFVLRHYAGPVAYSPSGLLEKNKDAILPPHLATCHL